ncbi:MAG: sulfatase [Fimbriiglobus sp.]
MRLFLVLVLLGCVGVSQAAEPVNVILIVADDLGVNDLGCYGRKTHRTPAIDKLAARGTRFANAYSACPVCSPTRAALMTGQHPARLHLTTFLPGRPDVASQKLLQPKIVQNLPATTPSLPQAFRQAGYATACIGKWHLGGKGSQPADFGFDVVYAGKPNTQATATEGGKGEFDLTAKAVSFIDDQSEKPFFLYLAHNNPHIPYTAQPERVKKFADAEEPTYAAMIETLDECVGQVVAKLEERKLRDKTLIIFTSDNGGLHVPELKHELITNNKPYRAGKGFLYEGGIRVPAIIAGPGVEAHVSKMPMTSMDWPATLAALCGLKLNAVDGMDLTWYLSRKGIVIRRNLFWHVPHYTNQGSRPGGAIVCFPYKLILHDEDQRVEVYDLESDPGETTDLSREKLSLNGNMLASLVAFRKLVKAQQNSPNPNFDARLHRELYIDFDPSTYDPTDPKQRPAALAWRKRMDAAVSAKK